LGKDWVLMLKTFLIAGGDLRYVSLAEKLAQKYRVYAIGFDKNIITSNKIQLTDNIMSLPERVDYIILPLPASNDGVLLNTPYCKQSIPLESIISVIKENGVIFGGRISSDINSLFTLHGLTVYDYAEREEFAVMNAIATAEGTIQIAMEELATTLFGQKILIIGMGRISKVLIKTLSGFETDITVVSRKYHDIAWGQIFGCRSIHINEIDNYLDSCNIVINTVPAIILDEKKLKKLDKNCLVIDLASKPGGEDFDLDKGVVTAR
jgi:dipicolinate synthase subunit A